MTDNESQEYDVAIEDVILSALLDIVAKKVQKGVLDPNKLPPEIRDLIIEEELSEEEIEEIKREVEKKMRDAAKKAAEEGREEEESQYGELELDFEHEDILRLVLRPKVDEHILHLISRLLNGSAKARDALVKILTDKNTPSSTRDYVVGVLAKSLAHNYRGVEEVLQQTLHKAKGSVYSSVVKSIQNHNEYAAQYLKVAALTNRLKPPSPQST